jgi:integrase
MISIKFRFVHEDIDRHGNIRVYFWRKGGRKVRIREKPGTEEFSKCYHELLKQSDAGKLAPPAKIDLGPKLGTYRWLCTLYFTSTAFQQLDRRTQHVRRLVIEKTWDEAIAPDAKEKFADFPIARMTAKAVRVIRDRKCNAPEAGNARVKAIRRIFAWALENEIEGVVNNPARDVPFLKPKRQGGIHSWTVGEVEQFERRHPLGTRAHLALALLLYTGVRRSDLVLLGKQHVRSGWLKFTVQKNRNRKPVALEIPLLPVLQEIIESSPTGDLTFLVSEFKRPFTPAGFGNWFRDRCNEAGLKHCSAHGLRKAGAAIRGGERRDNQAADVDIRVADDERG